MPPMRATAAVIAFGCLLGGTACHENSPIGPTVPLNQRFTLAPGESATVQDTSIRLEFERVSGDSRCPADAVCVWGGDAIVHVRARNGGSASLELHTGDSSRASATHAGVRLELVELQPYPFSSRTIEPRDYRATFTVTR